MDAFGQRQGADRRARDESELSCGPDTGEEASNRETVCGNQDGVDHEEDDGQTDVDGCGEYAERADCIPAVGGDSVGDQCGRTDWGEANDPPQDLLDDREQRRVELEERRSLGTDLECSNTDCTGDDEQLQDVEAQRCSRHAFGDGSLCTQPQEVVRNQSGDERPPRAGTLGFLRCFGGDVGP